MIFQNFSTEIAFDSYQGECIFLYYLILKQYLS